MFKIIPTDENINFLPTKKFCIRKPSAIFADGKYWIYADVIPWNHHHWPDTYDTSIHAFSSHNCQQWAYCGEIVRHRENGHWDFGGVATPGAVTLDNKTYIFYSGREKPGRDGKRQIGMAVAESPSGPFIKSNFPVIASEGPTSHLDDPIPVILPDEKTIRLYYRQADHHKPSPLNYRIRMRETSDEGKIWTEPVDILKSDGNPVRACETAEVAIINGETWLFTFDHLIDGTFQTVLRISQDGIAFNVDAVPLDKIFSQYFKRPQRGGGFQIVMIPDKDGAYRHVATSHEVDTQGHYSLAVLPIKL